jgi:hypothetical protein
MPDDLVPIERAEPAVEPAPSVASREAASLIEAIGRTATDPSTDVDKLDRLIGLYERITARSAKTAYAAALAEMQHELPTIDERGEIKLGDQVQNTYALWEDINEAIKPVLSRHGFALSFRTGREGEEVVVTGVLSHRDGHSEETTMRLPSDTSGGKNPIQAIGSSTSYGKRYIAAALLNLTSRGEDDDGVAGGGGLITEAQRDALLILAKEAGANKRKFCKFFGVESVNDLPSRDYKKAENLLKAKVRGKVPETVT